MWMGPDEDSCDDEDTPTDMEDIEDVVRAREVPAAESCAEVMLIELV
jgi:hypothetical protein